MTDAYFVSGLGADSRVFRHINLPEGYTPVFLDWIKPTPKESLQHYALRMAEKIDSSKPFVLIGLSMGGMIVSEISKVYIPKKAILISSCPTAAHLPPYFKFVKKLKLHRVLPVQAVKFSAISKRLFSAESPDDKLMIRKIIKESDNHFIKWAMDAVLHWDGMPPECNLVHIHGTKDEVLPIRYVKPTHIISKAGHMLVMVNADKVNKILAEEL